MLGGEVDPARASPGAEIKRRAPFRAGPDGKGGSVNRLARPDLAHHREMLRQQREAALIATLHGAKTMSGRPPADAEAEAPARKEVAGRGEWPHLDRRGGGDRN